MGETFCLGIGIWNIIVHCEEQLLIIGNGKQGPIVPGNIVTGFTSSRYDKFFLHLLV